MSDEEFFIPDYKDECHKLFDDGLQDAYLEVFKLVGAYLILPLNNTIVEHVFFKVNIMLAVILEDRMCIDANRPELTFQGPKHWVA